MSTDYRMGRDILMDEMFDGRLECFGIKELEIEGQSSANRRYLTDGENGVAVCGERTVSTIKRCGSNCPAKILLAVSEAFETRIYSEFDPQFWGFASQEEWDEYEAKGNEVRASTLHTNTLNPRLLDKSESDLNGRASSVNHETGALTRRFFESLRR